MNLSLRHITDEDRDLLFDWANDPEVRENAINSEHIKWPEHVEWFEAKLTDEESRIFILEKDGVPVGQVRFDKEEDYFKLDYLIARKYRGQGLGKKIVELGIGKVQSTIKAWVKKKNIASFKVMEDLGFRQEKTTREGLIQYSLGDNRSKVT